MPLAKRMAGEDGEPTPNTSVQRMRPEGRMTLLAVTASMMTWLETKYYSTTRDLLCLDMFVGEQRTEIPRIIINRI